MWQPDEIRIRHMVEAGEKAVGFAAERSRTDLDSDEMLRFALVKLVEIVGEAAKHVSDETRSRYPAVAWEASRMRDRLVHHYFDINLDILWSTVTEDLPALLEALQDQR
jgi:uncharacterized protein with HEPN domain